MALARALVNQPAIVLADEPTGNLDSQNSEIVLNMLRQSNQELGQTVLMITHNPEAAAYGDRIIHMRDGSHRAAREGPAMELSPMTEDLRSPILPGTGASDYERYLRSDELLALQKPPEEMLHPDELTFQVTHQASELLMKGTAWELDRARQCILEGDFRNAARLLRRANKMLDYPVRMLSLLETITPYEYHIIRAGLGHGSGLDSPGISRAVAHLAATRRRVF